MTRSYYASDRKVIPNRAYGYHNKEQGYVNKTIISFSVPFSSGSLMPTASDMLKWQNAINKNVLLSTKETPEHGGSVFGFKTIGVYIPGEDIYVIGLSNCDCNSPTQLTRDIANLALKSLTKGRQ